MDILNSKIVSSSANTAFEAQNVGLYGFDEGVDKWRRLKTNADGALNVDVEVNTSGLNLETTQVLVKNAVELLNDKTIRGIDNTGGVGDGSENATTICMGYDRINGQGRSLLVDSGGALSTTMVAGHGLATEAKQDTQETTQLEVKTAVELLNDKTIRGINNTGSIGDGSENATTICMGYDRTGGAGRSLLVDSGGRLTTVLTGNTNAGGSGTNYHLTCDSGGRMYINSDIGIPINAMLNDGGTTQKHLRCDAEGHLITARSNDYQTTQSVAVADTAMGNTTAYTITESSRVSVVVKETLNTPAATGKGQLQWSEDNSNWVSVDTTTNFQERYDADGSTSLGFFWTNINAEVVSKYMRFRVKNDDGGGSAHTYEVDVSLLPN